MTQKTLTIEVEGAGRYKTVTIETQTTLGLLKFAVEVNAMAAAVNGEEAAVKDAVLVALTEVVRHPAFSL